MSRAPILAASLAIAAGCGGAAPTGPAVVQPPPPDAGCVAACDGRACGPDGCGGSCGACAPGETCDPAGACQAPAPPACTPNCAGRICGPDGCGGSCGACGSAEACSSSGLCRPLSVNCPAGQQCVVFERLGWAYDCSGGPASCVRTGLVGTYPYADWCYTYACHGGNSTCGDQFGRSDPVTWACEACERSCSEGAYAVCPHEVEGGCYYADLAFGGYQIVGCLCQ